MSASTSQPLKVLLIEDDDEFASALQGVVPASLELTHARSAAEARAITQPPDAVAIDLGLPDADGVTLIRELVHRFPELAVVVLTQAHEPERVMAAFRAGARGYLFKEDADRLDAAVREARLGGAPMSPSVARWVLEWAQLSSNRRPTEARLTPRELDLVRLLADGCSYAQIAEHMDVSVNTVRTHVRNVYEKLAVGNRMEAVMAALRLGLISRRP